MEAQVLVAPEGLRDARGHAADAELAKTYAWAMYDEETWVEMCVVPRASIVSVTGHGKLPLWGN